MKRFILLTTTSVAVAAALGSCAGDDGDSNTNTLTPLGTDTSTTGSVSPTGPATVGPTPVGPQGNGGATGVGPVTPNGGAGPQPTGAVCGNGVLNVGEDCDDGNMTPGDGCEPDCTNTPAPMAECGNGTQEAGEQCDDGNMTAGDGCEPDCTTTAAATCGDGTVDDGEECDDGNTTGGDECEANCTLPVMIECGNGIPEEGEECDDGNMVADDGCEPDCTMTPAPPMVVCGDGEVGEGEECDDGNSENGDGCEADCTMTPMVDVTEFAAEIDGHTIIMPCGQFTSTEVCTPVATGMQFQGDPGLQGQISHYAEITFGGDPGTFYDVTVRVRGLVESKRYQNGTDRDGSGSQNPCDGLYIGGEPDNGSNGYNVYRLRTESPSANFYLNSCNIGNDARMFHGVFDADYEFTFTVEGGSIIKLSSADPNNSAIANCGDQQDNACPPTSLPDLDPLILEDIGAQPFDGQFIGFRVLDVVPAQ